MALFDRLSLRGRRAFVTGTSRGIGRATSVALPEAGADVTPVRGSGPYAPLKAALASYTMGLAREWGSDGVRVNAIAPGLIATDLTQEMFSDEHSSDRLAEGVSLGRIGVADEVSSVARFLASDAAAYITGAVILVDGGWVHQF